MRTLYKCPDCGSFDIQCAAYAMVNPYDKDYPEFEYDQNDDHVYCRGCDDAGFDGYMKWRHLIEMEVTDDEAEQLLNPDSAQDSGGNLEG